MAYNQVKENDTTEKWNTAKTYSALMIMKNLYSCDVLIMTAKYGSEIINDSLSMHPQDKVYSRLEAIERYVDTIDLIFKNTVKFLKKKDEAIFIRLRKTLYAVREVLPAIKETQYNMGINQTNIILNEEHFNVCLDIIKNINEEMIEPLNNAGLIFKETDEMDIEDIKRQIIEGG
jgi:hypothetical protein